jgi:hypothetical protein
MKLSLFFTLSVREDSDLSLFWLLIVSGRFWLACRWRLASLRFVGAWLEKLGNASG